MALQDGFEAVCDHLEQLEQSKYSRGRYKAAFSDISAYYENRKVTVYSPIINNEYRDRLPSRVKDGSISKKHCFYCCRLSFMLDSYYSGKPFLLKYSSGARYKVQLNGSSQALVDEFVSSLAGKMSRLSIPLYAGIARDFFFYIQEAGITELKNIRDEDIVNYIKDSHQRHPASMNSVCCSIRKILDFLSSKGCVLSRNLTTYKAAPTRRVIQPAISSDELMTILETPDRNTVQGKRDYAVLLLASFTGLRAIDIANLRFSNYKPNQSTIHLVQHKTGVQIGLPIPTEVVDAIDDYIEHGRPEIDCEYIFLTLDRPYRKLSDMSSVRNILMRQLKNSTIGYVPNTGHGFHIFRRTIGSWLLGASVDPEMISQVLGQRDGEVLKRYLPMVPNSMRDCALGFKTAPLRSEVLS